MTIYQSGARFAGVGSLRVIVDLFSSYPIPVPPGTTPGVPAGSSPADGGVVRGSDVAGGQQTGESLQSFFMIEGLLAVVLGDVVQSHGSGAHAFPRMAQGLSWFKINGIPACRQGHLASCGHATSGRSWFSMVG